tara:strand:- start:10007 stop:11767 length:1761 start_codon:yes stop_codon:yes gene_type:complete
LKNHLLRRLWSFIEKKRRTQLYLILALSSVVSFLEILSISAVIPFLGVLLDPYKVYEYSFVAKYANQFGINNPLELTFPVTVIFVSAVLISGVLKILLFWGQIRLGHSIGADISYRIFRSTIYQDYLTHMSKNSSDVLAAISEKTNGIITQIVLPIIQLFGSLLLILMLISTMLMVNPVSTFYGFIFLGVFYFTIISLTKRRLSVNGELISSLVSRRLKILQEGLGGIRDIALNNTQQLFTSLYRNADLAMRQAKATNSFIQDSPRFILEALFIIFIACFGYWMTTTKNGIQDLIPFLGALALGVQRLMPRLQQAYSSWSNLKGAKALLVDVLDILEQPLPKYIDNPIVKRLSFNNYINLQNVSFKYSSDTSWVLRNINIKIKKGTRIGLIGTTGGGKSTLSDLLMGLITPSRGKILVDNVPLNSRNCREWQANISHVPQSIFLADASIAENIAFGVPVDSIDHKRVSWAAKIAQIEKTICKWKENYQTVVGERGIRLSGGQRQRIGIARALYKKSSVIIFDEATSALDNNTETSVMRALEDIDENITIIIIAHRTTTLKKCDLIFEIDQGQIKTKGQYTDIFGDN